MRTRAVAGGAGVTAPHAVASRHATSEFDGFSISASGLLEQPIRCSPRAAIWMHARPAISTETGGKIRRRSA
jgi:hypothetical protein